MAPGGRFELPRPDGPYALKAVKAKKSLKQFKQFCVVDLNLTEDTAERHHGNQMRRFFSWLKDRDITTEVLREYLFTFNGNAPSTRANVIKAFRRFFRDFMKRGDLVESFQLPRQEFRPKSVPTRDELKKFYRALKRNRERAAFLMIATSGLRRDELTALTVGDINRSTRAISPNTANTATKKRWLTFYNDEAEAILAKHLNSYNGGRLFPWRGDVLDKWFRRASERSGVKITPKTLRDWFCNEMGRLGVQDRYVDAFCGRVPQSVLARHYTDYSPERLKEIYERAGLRIFS
ncbi:MAG: site-specific integrase [Methanobacteriota archaeon]